VDRRRKTKPWPPAAGAAAPDAWLLVLAPTLVPSSPLIQAFSQNEAESPPPKFSTPRKPIAPGTVARVHELLLATEPDPWPRPLSTVPNSATDD